ncbi:MAG: M20/M25/M40 family metallo-hydrolase [Coriobacteriales bacterium]|jgi:tripeptide aminopeptidase|nr:M20/M25/M40 family metallo-hydrolase [Coriobacteriales bacterium]
MDSRRLLNTFLDLVKIDSPSRQEAALAHYCAEVLQACGCAVRFDDTAVQTGSNTGNLFAVLPARGKKDGPAHAASAVVAGAAPAHAATPAATDPALLPTTDPFDSGTPARALCFSAHMDCVPPCVGVEPVIENGIIRSGGETILGGDDKVGIAAILELVRSLAQSTRSHPQINVIFSVQEELNLIGAKAMCLDEFAGQFCYVLDAVGSPGIVINGAPYQHSYEAVYTGLAAHAGVAPEKGISAIRAAARAVAALPQGRIDNISTANVGTIHGGSKNNIVAEECVVTGECRSHDPDRLAALHECIDATLRRACEPIDGAGPAHVHVEWELTYEGFSLAEDAPEVVLALKSARNLGLLAATHISGGGADTNVFVQAGMKAVSLSSGMDQIHSTSEQLALTDLEDLARLVIEIAYQFSN